MVGTAVPEAAVDEYGDTCPLEYQVGAATPCPGQWSQIDSIPQAPRCQISWRSASSAEVSRRRCFCIRVRIKGEDAVGHPAFKW